MTDFESFYRHEYRKLVSVAHVLTGSPTVAEELAQEAFADAFRTWSALESPEHWVRRVVANKAMSWWRRYYAERRAVSKLSNSTSGVVELPPETAGFWAEVRKLPRRQAQALALYYIDGYSSPEIAQILGCAEGTARIHLSRGRRNLANRLGIDE